VGGQHSLKLRLPDGSEIVQPIAPVAIHAGQPELFIHVALSLSGDRALFYVDGQPAGDRGGAAVRFTSFALAGLEVGRATSGYYAGRIKDVRLWRGARSPEQIA